MKKKYHNILYVDDSEASKEAERLLKRHKISFQKVEGPPPGSKFKKKGLPLLAVGRWELIFDAWGNGKNMYSIDDYVNQVLLTRAEKKEYGF